MIRKESEIDNSLGVLLSNKAVGSPKYYSFPTSEYIHIHT